jgi:hypothetical protein
MNGAQPGSLKPPSDDRATCRHTRQISPEIHRGEVIMSDPIDYREVYADMTARLLALRPLFSLNENLSKYREYFDDLLEASEFEVALHALCNFLSDPTTPGIGLSEIEKIELIHKKMELEDGCVPTLRTKSKVKGAE